MKIQHSSKIQNHFLCSSVSELWIYLKKVTEVTQAKSLFL